MSDEMVVGKMVQLTAETPPHVANRVAGLLEPKKIYMEMCAPRWLPCGHSFQVTEDMGGVVEGPTCPYCRIAQLEAFARDLIKRWDWSGDIDGGDFQDCAVAHGILVGVTVTEPCGELCNCADYHGSDMAEGVTCYRSALPEVGE